MSRQAFFARSKQDVLASIVTFLVALPLCMGIALASGVPPAAGLFAGAIGGLIVGYFTGCPLQVTGPAAGLIAVTWQITQSYGIDSLGVFVVLAGLMQIAIGTFNFASLFRAISPAVIQGGLAGLGILIAASQFHVMMDVTPESSCVQNILTIPETITKGLFPMDGSTHHMAAFIGLVTIMTVLAWSSQKTLAKRLPPPLIAVVIAVVFALAFKLPIRYIEIPSNPLAVMNLPNWQHLNLLLIPEAWFLAFSIAFVGTIETVLTMIAIERKGREAGQDLTANFDKEIQAQGFGNAVSGLLGLVPVAGVIIRSAANIDAGASTRLSTMLHGVWMLIPVAFLPFLLEHLPTSALAALLVYTGIRLVNLNSAKLILGYGWSEFGIYLATILGTVFISLMGGVLIGLVLSVIKLLHNLSHLDVVVKSTIDDQSQHIILSGSGSFLRLPKLVEILSQFGTAQRIILNTRKLRYIDPAFLDYIMNWEKEFIRQGGELIIET